MRVLFKWLFSKVKPIYIVPILILISVLFIYVLPTFISSNIMIKAEFPLDKSPNPEASKHFINAMEHKTKIGNLHRFIDYDNFLMKPFLDDLYSEYEKGKALLPKDSAEDVYWYVILFRGIHGIGGYPQRKDMSIAYENIYSEEEYKKHYEEILNKIRRLAEDDFNFDVPRITQYKYEFMSNLVDEITIILDEYTQRDKKNFLNKKYLRDLNDVYEYYESFSKKYLPLANKQNMNLVNDIHMKMSIYTDILFFKSHQSKSANCRDENYKKLIKNIKKLKQLGDNPQYKNKDFYLEGVFKNGKPEYQILRFAKKYCPNLKDELKNVLQYFSPELKKSYERRK